MTAATKSTFNIQTEKQGEQFLRTVFGSLDEASLALWTLQDRRTTFYKNTPKQASLNRFKGKDLYFALGMQQPDRRGNRAKRSEVIGIPGLWADIDYAHDKAHKKEDLPPTQKDAVRLIESLPIAPTFINCSGHGIHAFWLFKEPWMFEDTEEWKLAENLTKRWHELIKMEAARHGWVVDSVFDLARVLRVPGTLNHKDPENPVKCEVLTFNENAFIDVESIKEIAPEIEATLPVTPEKQITAEAKSATFVLRADAEPPAEKITILCDNDPDFNQMWNMKKHPKSDRSPSGYDMMLTHKLCSSRWSDQEIVDALLFFRRVKLKCDMKMHRPDYFANTILKARSFFKRCGAADQINDIQEERHSAGKELNEEDRKKLLMNLKDLMRVDIVRIDKYLEDPPVYFLVSPKGSQKIGTVDKIMSQTQFRYLLAGSYGVAIPYFKAQQWSSISQTILDLCHDIAVGRECSEESSMITYLEEYIGSVGTRMGFDKDTAFRMKIPFQNKDRICIFGTRFTKWLKGEHGVGISLQQLGRVLKQIKSDQVKMNFWPKGGRRTSSTVWMLPYGPFRDFTMEEVDDEE